MKLLCCDHCLIECLYMLYNKIIYVIFAIFAIAAAVWYYVLCMRLMLHCYVALLFCCHGLKGEGNVFYMAT